jgi:hypothetical protein
MWNAVDGQSDGRAKNANDAVGWEQEHQPNRGRRFRPLLGWELSGMRQRVPQGSIGGVIFCLARLFFASRSFNRLVAWTSAARSKDKLPAPKSKQSVKQLAVIA